MTFTCAKSWTAALARCFLVGFIGALPVAGVAAEETADGDNVGSVVERLRSTSTLQFDRLVPFTPDGPSSSECGLRAAFLLLKLRETPQPMEDVRARVPVASDGTSLEEMCRGLEELGCPVRAVRCAPENCREVPCPAIVHLESSGEWRHYMVLLDASEKQVRLADPVTMKVLEWSLSTYNQYSTGYYLIPSDQLARATGRQATFTVGMICFGCGLLIWWRAPLRRGRSAGMLLLACSTLTGCSESRAPKELDGADRAPPSAAARSKSTETATGVLEIQNPVKDLGPQLPGSVSRHRFHYRNTLDRPLTIAVQSTSCTCLKATLEPAGALAPGAAGSCEVELNSATNPTSGEMSAIVVLWCPEHGESHALQLSAGFPGLAGGQYILRPNVIERTTLPTLDLHLYSLQADTPFALEHLRVVEQRLVPQPEGTVVTEPPSESESESQFLEVDVSQLQMSEAEPLLSGLYRRRVSIPVRLIGHPANARGRFDVRYTLGGGSSQRTGIELMVIAEPLGG